MKIKRKAMIKNLKLENNIKPMRIEEAKKITRLILEKNKSDKERRYEKSHNMIKNIPNYEI